MKTRRRRVAVGLLLGLAGLVGLQVAWAWFDPWSPRRAIRAGDGTSGWGITHDGRCLIVSGRRAPDNAQVLRDFDLATGGPRDDRPDPLVPMRSYAPDGRSYVGLSTAGDRAVVRVDAATGEVTARYLAEPLQPSWPTLEEGGRSVRAYLYSGVRIVEVATWDVATGVVARRPFAGPPGAGPGLQVVQATPDRRTLLYLDDLRGGVQPWDGELDRPIGGPLRTSTTQVARLAGLEVTPDGRTLVVPRADGRAEIWDLPAGRLVRVVPVHSTKFASTGMALAADGRLLASGGHESSAPGGLGAAWARIRDLSPALRARETREVVVVDLATGRRLARFPGELDPLLAPDGRTLVTQAPDRSFLVRAVPALPPPPATPAGIRQ